MTFPVTTVIFGRDYALFPDAASTASDEADSTVLPLPSQTRLTIAGLSSDDGGIIRFMTFKNSVANVPSRAAAT